MKNRKIKLQYFLLALAGVGMGLFAFYHYFFVPNPVTDDNMLTIHGHFDRYDLEEGDSARFLFWLEEYPLSFSIGTTYSSFKVDEFLENEQPGAPLTLQVNQKQYHKPRKAPIYPDLLLVDVYALSSEQGEYLTVEDSFGEYETEKRMALAVGIMMAFCSFILFFISAPKIPALGEVQVPWDNVFFAYATNFWAPDVYYMMRVTAYQIEAACVGGQLISPTPLQDPLALAQKELIEKYIQLEQEGRPWVDADQKNFIIPSGDVERVEISEKKRLWVAPHTHVGTIYFHFHDQKPRPFILLGKQSIPDLCELLRKNHFPVPPQ